MVESPEDTSMALPPPPTLLDEITDFLLERPTPNQIIAFQPSDLLNDRLHDLLNKNQMKACLQRNKRS